jgi:hypothetical protein
MCLKSFFLPVLPKAYVLGLLIMASCSLSFAQDDAVAEYLEKSGEFAGLFNGQIKTDYNQRLYDNNPYYKGSDFAAADIIYKGISFPGQKVLLDLFEEQLILLSPQKHYGMILDSEKVEKVLFKDETFIWLSPPDKSGIAEGFYSLLTDGKHTKLLFKEKFTLDRTKPILHFYSNIRHYLFLNGRYHSVKNKKSFTKLFPQYKKQINIFVKKQNLDFGNHPRQSLIQLADYCEALLSSNNNQ